ncbi:MAG: nucleoside deaminase [Bacteroidales bacterium]
MGNDKLFLRKAIEIAMKGIEVGSGPFGAIIVKDNKIISEASNMVILNNDPTAHAEILAIRQASSVLHMHDLNECTLYSSCEPCPMCLGAIYWSGIMKVVYSCDRTDAESAGFSDKLIYNELLLEPLKRSISFIRLNDSRGKDVFRKWNELGNKVTY